MWNFQLEKLSGKFCRLFTRYRELSVFINFRPRKLTWCRPKLHSPYINERKLLIFSVGSLLNILWEWFVEPFPAAASTAKKESATDQPLPETVIKLSLADLQNDKHDSLWLVWWKKCLNSLGNLFRWIFSFIVVKWNEINGL